MHGLPKSHVMDPDMGPCGVCEKRPGVHGLMIQLTLQDTRSRSTTGDNKGRQGYFWRETVIGEQQLLWLCDACHNQFYTETAVGKFFQAAVQRLGRSEK